MPDGGSERESPLGGARDEEGRLTQGSTARPVGSGLAVLRRLLGRVPFLRSGWGLALTLKHFLLDSSGRARADFDREFTRSEDPWGYDTPEGQKRLRRAMAMLDAARGAERFPQALEIGCAAGAFTELLASRCDSLLAVDISPVALQRSHERRSWPESVRFAEWDLRRDPLPGIFDLIVVMSVLEYYGRPRDLRAAREKLVEGVNPGGYLLVGDVRQSELYETTWWGKRLIRGGKWISEFVAEHPALKLVERVAEDYYVLALFRKVA